MQLVAVRRRVKDSGAKRTSALHNGATGSQNRKASPLGLRVSRIGHSKLRFLAADAARPEDKRQSRWGAEPVPTSFATRRAFESLAPVESPASYILPQTGRRADSAERSAVEAPRTPSSAAPPSPEESGGRQVPSAHSLRVYCRSSRP